MNEVYDEIFSLLGGELLIPNVALDFPFDPDYDFKINNYT